MSDELDTATSLTGDGAPEGLVDDEGKDDAISEPQPASGAVIQDNVSTPGVQRTTFPNGEVSEHGKPTETEAGGDGGSAIDPGPDGHQDQSVKAGQHPEGLPDGNEVPPVEGDPAVGGAPDPAAEGHQGNPVGTSGPEDSDRLPGGDVPDSGAAAE